MTIEELLRRYLSYKAALNMKKILINAIKNDIITDSGMGSGERIQTSGISDSTAKKAFKMIEKTEKLEGEMKKYQLIVDLIENAMTVLDEREHAIIVNVCFKGQTYAKIDCETNMPRETSRKVKKMAIEKLEPYLKDLLRLTTF